ncbi:hypothetical protein BDC45DRAFT_505995 [Circinella umbellata]|nr:hypothetical protein BDC45DRAFT_505995 [Circinella umbellata]
MMETYNYYYQHQHYQPSASSSSSSSRPSSPPLPLTKENLSLYVNQQEETEPSFTLMSRYYNDLPPPSPVLSARRERRNSSNTTSSSDFVVATPRLSPFPYHNDSLFLPTAEQQHSNNSTLMKRSKSPTPSIDTFTSYPGRRSSSTAERRPSPLSTQTIPSRYPPLFEHESSSTSTNEKLKKPQEKSIDTTSTNDNLPRKKISWWLRISKLLNIRLKKKNKPSASTSSLLSLSTSATTTTTIPFTPSTSRSSSMNNKQQLLLDNNEQRLKTPMRRNTCRLNEGSPVWYSQFTANPPPPSKLSMATAA